MHDWTLVSVQVDWQAATVAIVFRNADSEQVLLTADEFTDLHIPKREEWGASISVNEASDIELLPNGQQRLAIEMQSGDVLLLEARSIQLSSAANLPSEITSRIVHEARKGRYVDDFSVDELK